MKFLQREWKILSQERELKQLREELETLRAQNESMRAGMRRCITCEYRIAVKEKDDVTT
jgi:uncharacterized protein with PIN domain